MLGCFESSLWSPIFRHFSGPSPAPSSGACRRSCREEIALAHKTGDPKQWHHRGAPPAAARKSFRTGIVVKKKKKLKKGQHSTHLSVLFHSRLPRVWLTASAGWAGGKPGNRPIPFRGCHRNPREICAVSGRRPGIHWNHNSHCLNSVYHENNDEFRLFFTYDRDEYSPKRRHSYFLVTHGMDQGWSIN